MFQFQADCLLKALMYSEIGGKSTVQYPAQGFFFFFLFLGASPHCSDPSSLLGKWEDPKRRSKREELFESSVIQKRPFNVRSWGAEGRKCRWHRSKLLKQLSFRKGRRRKVSVFFNIYYFWERTTAQKRSQEKDRENSKVTARFGEFMASCGPCCCGATLPGNTYY